MKSTTSPQGDVADKSGFSPFPGNINALVVNANAYESALSRSNGIVPEFINPKYKDDSKKAFKKPTRLECMMQDLPKLLVADKSNRIGFTAFERWACFSAVKNSLEGGAAKQKKTGFAESAATGEADTYRYYRKVLAETCGVNVRVDGEKVEFTKGISTTTGAKIILRPCERNVTMSRTRKMFPNGSNVSISDRSTLVVDGNVTFENLKLDGALYVCCDNRKDNDSHLIVKNLVVKNKGWTFDRVENDDSVDEVLRIRGYKLTMHETHTIISREHGCGVTYDGAIEEKGNWGMLTFHEGSSARKHMASSIGSRRE